MLIILLLVLLKTWVVSMSDMVEEFVWLYVLMENAVFSAMFLFVVYFV